MRQSAGLAVPGALLALLLAVGCDEAGGEAGGVPEPEAPAARADVTAVSVAGDASAYQFSVTVQSPDTGCDRYADWWEVLTPEGTLLYRRILAHSHVDEQPFTRSGGPVVIGPDDTVRVRAHLSVGGYGGRVMQGSVAGGFAEVAVDEGFAAALAEAAPLPDGCAF